MVIRGLASPLSVTPSTSSGRQQAASLSLSRALSLSFSLYPSSPLSPLVGASKRKKEERKKRKVSKGYKARGAVSGGRNGSAQKTHSCASSAACQNVRWRGRGGGGGVGGGGGREGGGRGEEKI